MKTRSRNWPPYRRPRSAKVFRITALEPRRLLQGAAEPLSDPSPEVDSPLLPPCQISVPALPALSTPQAESSAVLSADTPAIPDLTVTLGGSQIGALGATVVVPVTVSDDAYGLISADLTITYIAGLLDLADADVTLDAALVAGGWAFARDVNDITGVVRISMFTTGSAITRHGNANLLRLSFHVPTDEIAGVSPIAVDTSIDPNTGMPRSRLNEGQLALTSVPGAIIIDNTALTVGSSTVVLDSPRSFSVISVGAGGHLGVAARGSNLLLATTLNISPGGLLDLADNDLVLIGTGSTSFDTVRGYLRDGRMITSVPKPLPFCATLAEVDNRELHLTKWSNVPISDGVDFSQVIVKYAYLGDANLDGKVDDGDYLNVLSNLGRVGATSINGDLNNDGLVTVADFAVISANFGAGTGGEASQLLVAQLLSTASTGINTNVSQTPGQAQVVKPASGSAVQIAKKVARHKKTPKPKRRCSFSRD
jgi:hypothetical protein